MVLEIFYEKSIKKRVFIVMSDEHKKICNSLYKILIYIKELRAQEKCVS
jgi:hypothetical protein